MKTLITNLMTTRIFEVIIGVLILVLILSALFGCESSFKFSPGSIFSGSEIIDNDLVPPSAAEQLWQAAKSSNWLVTVSILIIAGGAFAFFNGSKIGIPVIAAGSVSLFMALAVARFALWMAICGFIGCIAAIVVSILVKKEALVQLVKGAQNLKYCINDAKEVDGSKILSDQQNKRTQKLVREIKSNLKLKGKI